MKGWRNLSHISRFTFHVDMTTKRFKNDQCTRASVWMALFLLLLSVVVLSHPVFAQEQEKRQADIAFVGLHGGIFESLKEFEKELDVKLEYLTDEMIAGGKLDLSTYKVIFLQHLRAEDRDAYRAIFQSAKKRNPKLRIISISGRFDMLKDLNIVEHDPEVRKYYGSSKENLRRLLIYTLAKYMGRELEILPPEEVSFQVIYHPDYGGFRDVQEFLNWSRKRGWDVENAPRALITVHTTHLVFQQPKVVDALIREFEKRKILTVAMIDTAEGYSAEQYEAMVLEYNPEAVVHTCHSRENVSFREKLQAPHLHSIFFRKQSIDEWYKSDRGLDPGTVTFQVMTQELRGAIEPQIGAGTLLGGGSDEAFTPIPERIEHLVKRAASWKPREKA